MPAVAVFVVTLPFGLVIVNVTPAPAVGVPLADTVAVKATVLVVRYPELFAATVTFSVDPTGVMPTEMPTDRVNVVPISTALTVTAPALVAVAGLVIVIDAVAVAPGASVHIEAGANVAPQPVGVTALMLNGAAVQPLPSLLVSDTV